MAWGLDELTMDRFLLKGCARHVFHRALVLKPQCPRHRNIPQTKIWGHVVKACSMSHGCYHTMDGISTKLCDCLYSLSSASSRLNELVRSNSAMCDNTSSTCAWDCPSTAKIGVRNHTYQLDAEKKLCHGLTKKEGNPQPSYLLEHNSEPRGHVLWPLRTITEHAKN